MRTERPWQPDAYVSLEGGTGVRCLRMRPPAHRPRVFKSETVVVPPVIPEPEVRARAADPWEIPKAAATFILKAEAAGWTVRTTYARGPYSSSLKHYAVGPQWQGRMVDSILVRLNRDGCAAGASWLDGRTYPEGTFFMGEDLQILHGIGVKEVLTHLLGQG